MTNLDNVLKSRDVTLPKKVHIVNAMVFLVVMFGCKIWAIEKAECWRIDTFELWCWRRLLTVPWSARRSNRSILKVWLFIGRTGAKAKAPILWPPDANSQLIGKNPDARKAWRQKEKSMAEDEMVGTHHWLNGHELGQTPGDGKGQWNLACCSPWGCKELDTTWWLNNNNTGEGLVI